MTDAIQQIAARLSQAPIEDRMRWRMIPLSQNIEDRRGQGTTLADIAQKAIMWLSDDRPTPFHSQNPNMPSALFGDDISTAADQAKFATILRRMNEQADSRAANEAWLQSIEKPPLKDERTPLRGLFGLGAAR